VSVKCRIGGIFTLENRRKKDDNIPTPQAGPTTMAAGYSGKPLAQKLGIKSGFRMAVVNAPEHYDQILTGLPENVAMTQQLDGPLDLVHFFTTERRELADRFLALKQAIAQNGMLWISWPKGASKIKTDLNENVIREIGLQNGLVDVKVAAIDETWSGLKFVYRTEDRK
jgi:hypothetical protein